MTSDRSSCFSSKVYIHKAMISQSQALEKTQRLLSIVVAASRRSCIHKIASKNGDAFIRAIIEQSFTV